MVNGTLEWPTDLDILETFWLIFWCVETNNNKNDSMNLLERLKIEYSFSTFHFIFDWKSVLFETLKPLYDDEIVKTRGGVVHLSQ